MYYLVQVIACVQTSHELQRFQLKIGHWDSSTSTDHQNDISNIIDYYGTTFHVYTESTSQYMESPLHYIS